MHSDEIFHHGQGRTAMANGRFKLKGLVFPQPAPICGYYFFPTQPHITSESVRIKNKEKVILCLPLVQHINLHCRITVLCIYCGILSVLLIQLKFWFHTLFSAVCYLHSVLFYIFWYNDETRYFTAPYMLYNKNDLTQ